MSPTPYRTGHTPGRWIVQKKGVNGFEVWLEGWQVPKQASRDADAHLIAAAPDLLEALKHAAHEPGSVSFWHGQASQGDY